MQQQRPSTGKNNKQINNFKKRTARRQKQLKKESLFTHLTGKK